MNPAFSQILLDTFMGVFNSQSRKLVNDLEKEVGKGLFDHWTYTRHNALETICCKFTFFLYKCKQTTNAFFNVVNLL